MLTIQDKIERYNQILKQIAEHTIESDDISDELFMLSQEEYELKEDMINYIYEHKLYKPIGNLQKFEGMSLKSITLVTKWGKLINLKNYNDITVVDGYLFAKYFDVVGYINLRIADGLFEDILKDIATKEVV